MRSWPTNAVTERVLAAAVFFSAALMFDGASGQSGTRNSGDQHDESQTLIINLLDGNVEEERTIARLLRLEPRLDIPLSLKDGSLIAQVRALQPLQSQSVFARPPEREAPLAKDPKAYFADSTKWTVDNNPIRLGPHGRLRIPVCWVNKPAEEEAHRKLVQAAVTATWQHHGRLLFVGWDQQCRAGSSGIKIQTANARPYSAYGNESKLITPSMVLDFSLSRQDIKQRCPVKETCIFSIAVHEFGHALGFLHEQDSPDTPPACKAKLKPGDSIAPSEALRAKMITGWDEFSVMDYCFDIYSQRVQLSDCDIAALHSLYGAPERPPYKPTCKLQLVNRN